MAALIAPSIARFAIEGTINGRAYANVLHYRLFQLLGISREGACRHKAGDILNSWNGHMMQYQSASLTLDRVSWLDLDSEDGSRGERTSTGTVNWPASGAQSVTMAPNVSMRVNKQSTAGRGQRSGRIYIGPPQETWTTGDISRLIPSIIEDVNESLENFRSDTEGAESVDGGGDYDCGMVVVHTRNGQFRGYSDVTGLTLESLLATQRRRLR